MQQNDHTPVLVDPAVEAAVREKIITHYLPTYQERVYNYADMILEIDDHVSRFEYIKSVVGEQIFAANHRILVSGFSTGSEMILARRYGFGKVHGVEVDSFLVEICTQRLKGLPEMYPVYYDGDKLPYADEQFDVIQSGHVIEHTRSPMLYVKESMRVLAPGGYLSLEYPTRYHRRELHTGLRSFEWLPHILRNIVLRLLYNRISPLTLTQKQGYRAIVETKLQQISILDIYWMLVISRYPFKIVHKTEAAPGIIRAIIRKKG